MLSFVKLCKKQPLVSPHQEKKTYASRAYFFSWLCLPAAVFCAFIKNIQAMYCKFDIQGNGKTQKKPENFLQFTGFLLSVQFLTKNLESDFFVSSFVIFLTHLFNLFVFQIVVKIHHAVNNAVWCNFNNACGN